MLCFFMFGIDFSDFFVDFLMFWNFSFFGVS